MGVGPLLITGKKLAQLMSARPLGLEQSPGLDTGQWSGGNAPRCRPGLLLLTVSGVWEG